MKRLFPVGALVVPFPHLQRQLMPPQSQLASKTVPTTLDLPGHPAHPDGPKVSSMRLAGMCKNGE